MKVFSEAISCVGKPIAFIDVAIDMIELSKAFCLVPYEVADIFGSVLDKIVVQAIFECRNRPFSRPSTRLRKLSRSPNSLNFVFIGND
jgi:hypothetical protein